MQHYLLKETRSYEQWRAQKLYRYPEEAEQLIIELNNPIKLMDNEIELLINTCQKTNIAIYRCSNIDHFDQNSHKKSVIAIAEQLGLQQLDANLCADEDRISIIQDTDQPKSHYIPYTNKPLNWHTDGYYNASEQRIRAFIMHCVRSANYGGENFYLDPEIAYILMRDENPDYIAALMHDDVMMIPANEINGKLIRPAQSGPVFSTDVATQKLYMRYTARQRNIIWKQDKSVQSALSFLNEILEENPYLYRYRLKAGEGVVCNNVLHNRTAFEDYEDKSKKRMLFRGRFYNRVASRQQHLNNAVNN